MPWSRAGPADPILLSFRQVGLRKESAALSESSCRLTEFCPRPSDSDSRAPAFSPPLHPLRKESVPGLRIFARPSRRFQIQFRCAFGRIPVLPPRRTPSQAKSRKNLESRQGVAPPDDSADFCTWVHSLARGKCHDSVIGVLTVREATPITRLIAGDRGAARPRRNQQETENKRKFGFRFRVSVLPKSEIRVLTSLLVLTITPKR